MPITQKGFTYDHEHRLKDAGLVASSAAAQVDSAAKVIDFGPGRVDARAILDVTAVEAASNDELYTVELQVSNSPTFASGVVVAGAVKLGALEVTGESVDTAVPARRELHFTNDVNGTVYRYGRLFTRVAGTIATGVNYSAFLVLGTR